MARSIFMLAVVWSALSLTAHAQCNRGGGGPSAGNITSTGSIVPSALVSSLSGNPFFASANQLARQQIAQRQYAQRYTQQLARRRYLQASRQQQLANQQRQREGTRSRESDSGSSIASNPRRQRLLRENAEKAFASARKAEMNERYSTAERQYRKVIALLGEDTQLASQSKAAIEQLASRRSWLSEGTALASVQAAVR